MKKLIAVMLSLIFAFVLFGCDFFNTTASTSNMQTTSDSQTVVTTQSSVDTSTTTFLSSEITNLTTLTTTEQIVLTTTQEESTQTQEETTTTREETTTTREETTTTREETTTTQQGATTVLWVYYDSNGGGVVDDESVVLGQSISLPITERVGYTFIGWSLTGDQSAIIVEEPFYPNSDITLYAVWEINQSQIIFDSNGGSDVLPISQDYNSVVVQPDDPLTEGYNFGGWYTDSELSVAFIFDTMPAEDVTLYAKWNVNSYTLQYIDEDGTVLYTSDFEYNSDLNGVSVDNPNILGHSFDAWDTVLPVSMPASNLTIQATYIINQYTISFDSNGGSELSSITQDYDTSISKPANPIREGYTFNAWYIDSELTEIYTFTTIPAENIIIYVKWDINQYTITFHTNNGSLVNSITEDYYTDINAPIEPTREGHTFDGWYTVADFSHEFTFDKMQSSDITIYAKWNVNQYTILFETDGGSLVDSFNQDYETVVSAPIEPTKEGYTFGGWYSTSDFSQAFIFNVMPSYDTTIYAKWNINSYTLQYIDEDGTVLHTEDLVYNLGLSGVIEPNASKIGHTFNGWSELLPFTMPANNLTLTAVYTINQYTIWLDSNDGTLIDVITEEYGTSIVKPTDPIKVGHAFDGWYMDSEFTIAYSFTTMPAVDINIYAKWLTVVYRIIFDSDGGSLVNSIHEIYNTEINEPIEPTKEGYTFGGWYTTSDFSQAFIFNTMPPSVITLYAKWNVNSYTLQYIDDDGTVLYTGDYEYHEDLSLIVEPSAFKIGYTFTGWSILSINIQFLLIQMMERGLNQ